MKGPGAAQPRNNAPFHSLSDTHTRSSMSDPPRLPPDLIWGAVPLSPAYAPTDVFIITLSFYLWLLGEETGWKGWGLGVRRTGRGARTGARIIVTEDESSLLPSAVPMAPPSETSTTASLTIIKLINFKGWLRVCGTPSACSWKWPFFVSCSLLRKEDEWHPQSLPHCNVRKQSR